jgi:hypothetical protein
MFPAVIRIKDRNCAGEGFSHAVFDGQYYCFADGEQCRLEALQERYEIYDVGADDLANMLDAQGREKADSTGPVGTGRSSPRSPPKSFVAAGIRALCSVTDTGNAAR